jgi:type I restriction enzyme S subunit
MPSTPPPEGWRWSLLTNLARLESGHTPSRQHPEYWGGDIPWIGIADARAHHGLRIEDTEQRTNDLGIANSSARILPENTVCLSRTASVGYVVVLGRPMATSQDFVNWVCTKELDHNFLKYLLIAEDEDLLRFASGSVHQTIYFPEAKAFHICHPPLPEQQRIVGLLDEAFGGLATAQAHAAQNLQNARDLFESHLNAVFTQRGEGWVETTIGEVCTLRSGTTVSPQLEREVGDIPYLKVADMTFDGNEDRITTSSRFLSHADIKGRSIIPTGATIFPKRGGAILTNKKRITSLPICADLNIMAVIPLPQVDSGMLFFYFQNVDMRKLGTGTSIPQINNYDVGPLAISFPKSIREQKRIATQLDALSAETLRLTRIYEQKLAALAALKKSLLHQAFSGEL